jgi:hypothetical protein
VAEDASTTDDELEAVPGLSCPRCQAAQVEELPADGISPHPGYRCGSCGARLRGMTFTYGLAILLGLGLLAVAVGVVTVFGDDRDATLRGYVRSPMGTWSAFVMIPLYVFLVAYAGRQLLRPRPRRA